MTTYAPEIKRHGTKPFTGIPHSDSFIPRVEGTKSKEVFISWHNQRQVVTTRQRLKNVKYVDTYRPGLLSIDVSGRVCVTVFVIVDLLKLHKEIDFKILKVSFVLLMTPHPYTYSLPSPTYLFICQFCLPKGPVVTLTRCLSREV